MNDCANLTMLVYEVVQFDMSSVCHIQVVLLSTAMGDSYHISFP